MEYGRYILTTLVAIMLVPVALADPATQTGVQTGVGWNESTFITVQGGTGFTLSGQFADFDIQFYDADGNWLGWSIACGDDAGAVPVGAVVGEIMKWDDVGALAPCTVPGVGLPGIWTYTDGL